MRHDLPVSDCGSLHTQPAVRGPLLAVVLGVPESSRPPWMTISVEDINKRDQAVSKTLDLSAPPMRAPEIHQLTG